VSGTDIAATPTSVALAFVTAHGTIDGRGLAKRLGMTGPLSSSYATALSRCAWNWHIYGPNGTSPSTGMARFTRKQVASTLSMGVHPTMDALITEVTGTPETV
jgi:hypothetical protein